MKKLILLITFICCGLVNSFATIHFLNNNATGANDGTSWADAFVSLQAAINAAAEGDTLFMKNGVYLPSSFGMDYAFEITTDIYIYGGFDGTEATLSERAMTGAPFLVPL